MTARGVTVTDSLWHRVAHRHRRFRRSRAGTPDRGSLPPHNEDMTVEPAHDRGVTRPAPTEAHSLAADDVRRRRADEHWNRRRDLERQLHDGPAVRIAALALHLGLLAEK